MCIKITLKNYQLKYNQFNCDVWVHKILHSTKTAVVTNLENNFVPIILIFAAIWYHNLGNSKSADFSTV